MDADAAADQLPRPRLHVVTPAAGPAGLPEHGTSAGPGTAFGPWSDEQDEIAMLERLIRTLRAL